MKFVCTQFKLSNNSIRPIDRNLSGATIRVDLEAMAMEGYSAFPQSSSITGASPSDCLVSYPGHLLGESYPSVDMQSVYSMVHSILLSLIKRTK